jgi:ATP-dependent RNA helicase DDX60
MDLDRFDEIDITPTTRFGKGSLTVQQTLGSFDDLWYSVTYRQARWMDLLGDYAGSELFILDGGLVVNLELSLIRFIQENH